MLLDTSKCRQYGIESILDPEQRTICELPICYYLSI